MANQSYLPDDAPSLLEMTDEDVGFAILLELVNKGREQGNKFSPHNERIVFVQARMNGRRNARNGDEDKISLTYMEGFNWLLRTGLIAKRGEDVSGDWSFVTRRGFAAAKSGSAAKVGTRLDDARLVEALALRVRPLYSAGQFDSAIMQAFKEVEVAVRAAGGYTDNDLGVKLMRQAFDPQNGPLTDLNVPSSERDGVAALFAGAIGFAKNPHSHRNVGTVDPNEALELILFANHLLRIVASRARG